MLGLVRPFLLLASQALLHVSLHCLVAAGEEEALEDPDPDQTKTGIYATVIISLGAASTQPLAYRTLEGTAHMKGKGGGVRK